MQDHHGEIVGVVPAAGRGRRVAGLRWLKELYPLGQQMVDVGGVLCPRPKVASEYLIESLSAAGATKIGMILGEGKHDLMSYYGDGARFGLSFSYFFQEDLRGVPYAIRLVVPWLPQEHTVLFGMPDTVIDDPDCFVELLKQHAGTASDLTLGLFKTESPSKFGMVRLEGSRPVQIVDKPAVTDLEWMWGIACWSQRFTEFMINYVSAFNYTGRELVPGDVFAAALHSDLQTAAVQFADARYTDIGTPHDLNAASRVYGTLRQQ